MKKTFFYQLFIILSFFITAQIQATIVETAPYIFDDNHIRYQLVSHKKTENEELNWLFIPGGPGLDSSSLLGLAQLADLPGKTWLIDLPGNGSNRIEHSSDYNYDQWFELIVPMVKRFKNPIIVGVSFGGVISLLTPELENHLKGFIVLNSSLNLWLEDADECAQ